MVKERAVATETAPLAQVLFAIRLGHGLFVLGSVPRRSCRAYKRRLLTDKNRFIVEHVFDEDQDIGLALFFRNIEFF